MDMTHRIPFPSFDAFQNQFSRGEANIFFNDCRLKNINRLSNALNGLTAMVNQFNETELFAVFVAARHTMQNSSQKVRSDSLHLFLALSKTSICAHTVPYIMLLTHDDCAQIKSEASSNFTNLLKEIGGLGICLPQLIPAIGSMGHLAFSVIHSDNVEELISNSRLASCVILATTQILTLLVSKIRRKSMSELMQYLKIALEGIRGSFSNPESPITLFFNMRLRCCYYRLQQETQKIPGCPILLFNDFLREKDPQCLKYIAVLVKSTENVAWERLIENPFLLNEFIDNFLQNVPGKTLATAFHLLTDENIKKVTDILFKKNNLDIIDFNVISNKPHLWESIPNAVLKRAAELTATGNLSDLVDAKFIIQFPTCFKTPACISVTSTLEDAAEAFIILGTPNDIDFFINKFPQSVITAIKKWVKTPKTDWYVPSLNLEKFILEDALTIKEIVPEEKMDEFCSTVDKIIVSKIQNNEHVPNCLWQFTKLPDELCQLIIERQIEIETDNEEIRKNIYEKLFDIIEETKSEADAGAMIGKISSIARVESFHKTHSYDFLETYFSEVELTDAPDNVAIQFLDGYLSKEFPNFEITFLKGTFTLERTTPSISHFLSKLTQQEKENVLRECVKHNLYSVSLFLIATTNTVLDIPEVEFFAPFLVNIDRYSKWVNDFDDPFVKFLKNPDSKNQSQSTNVNTNQNENKNENENESGNNDNLVDKDHPLFLFASAASHQYPASMIYEIALSKISGAKSLDFFLILESLLNVGFLSEKYTETLLCVLSAIPSLPALNSLILSSLEKFFCLSIHLDEADIFDLLSKCSLLLSTNILCCLKSAAPLYVEKINYTNWLQLRTSLAKGPVSSLSTIDDAIASKFDIKKTEMFTYLIENFPNAASKWFTLQNQDAEIRERISRLFSLKMIPALIKTTVDAIQSKELEIECTDRIIKCQIVKDDDSFHLQIRIPDHYPLELPHIIIKSIGKDSVTRDCIDEVLRESLRPNGLIGAVLTWKARILSIVNNEKPCPICLSLLNERGELPKARCPTCHQTCHASCQKQWMANSIKKICPWCRSLWKQPRNRPKRQTSSPY